MAGERPCWKSRPGSQSEQASEALEEHQHLDSCRCLCSFPRPCRKNEPLAYSMSLLNCPSSCWYLLQLRLRMKVAKGERVNSFPASADFHPEVTTSPRHVGGFFQRGVPCRSRDGTGLGDWGVLWALKASPLV